MNKISKPGSSKEPQVIIPDIKEIAEQIDKTRDLDSETQKPKLTKPKSKDEGEKEKKNTQKAKKPDAPPSVLHPILLPFLRSQMTGTTQPTISTFVPSAFKMYHLVHIMDDIIRKNTYFKRRQDAWHPFISRIYFGIVFVIQITRAEISAGVASIKTKNFYRKFSKRYPPETLPIPGPLVTLFAQLVPTKSSNPLWGLITPKLPEALGCDRAIDLLSYNPNGSHQLIIPNIPFLVGLMNSITTAEPGFVPDYSRPNTFSINADRTINGHVFHQNAWEEIERACLQTPGLIYLAETDDTINANAGLYAARINIPPVPPATNLTSRAEFTRLIGDMTWFGDLLAIMETYCEYFSDSSNLATCKVESSFAPLMTTHYSKATAGAPLDTLTRAFPSSSIFTLDAMHTTTEQTVPPASSMLAESSHLNVVISIPEIPWNSIGTATRAGPYWQETPVRFRSKTESVYSSEAAVITKHYALTRPSNK